MLQPHHGNDQHLVLSNPVVWTWRGRPHRLPDHRQQFDRNAGLVAEGPETRVAQGCPAVIRRRVDEGQREQTAPDRTPEALEGQAGPQQSLDDPDAPDVPLRQKPIAVRLQDALVDQALDESGFGTRSLGDQIWREPLHGREPTKT
jgi:hypothetical protein